MATKKIGKNKSIEFDLGRHEEWSYFDLDMRITRNVCHAGWYFSIELFGLYISLSFHDNRHWDYDRNVWEKY